MSRVLDALLAAALSWLCFLIFESRPSHGPVAPVVLRRRVTMANWI